MKSKNKTGITCGDPAGIGAEIISKALIKTPIKQRSQFTIIGDLTLFEQHLPNIAKQCSFIDIPLKNKNRFKAGRITAQNGQASLDYLDHAIKLLKHKEIDALVTGPLCKEAVCLSQPTFVGHTEYLANAFHSKSVGMLFIAQKMRVIIVTRHIALKKISRAITRDLVYETIALTASALKNQFHIKNPKLAVCGLNPHAGEGGRMGTEELTEIIPAIKHARKNKINAGGPFAADTLFTPNNIKGFDAVIAMYHDQGCGPIKTLYMNELVNCTIGLPIIRTSPAHGTAFDIAGKNKADPSSMVAAIKCAAQLLK
ncbi:4-hydroxythreonine-4-phosphate dehydrogenase PdxA [Candidatus Omnitrophota bacterium]